MKLNNNAVTLVTLAGLIIAFFSLLYLYIKFKQIKVVRNNKNLSKEEMQVKIEQLKIINEVSKISQSKMERLVRLSGNPLGLTPAIFTAIIYIVPALCALIGLWFSLIGEDTFCYFMIVIGILCFWYPPYHYKEKIRARENAWFKIQQHLYKLSEELESNDYKKALLNVSTYLFSIKEDELARGLAYMVEKWPDKAEDINAATEEFEYYYPFEIARDLFVLLLNAEQSGVSSTQRIESFKGTVIMKYNKFADKELSRIPAITTCLSLPFLMLSCIVALLVPAIINMLQYF